MIDRNNDFFRRQTQTFPHTFDNANISLMRHQPVNFFFIHPGDFQSIFRRFGERNHRMLKDFFTIHADHTGRLRQRNAAGSFQMLILATIGI